MDVNNHEFQGRVLAKSQKYPVGSKGMVKGFLYCEGDYIVAGNPRIQQAKFTVFSFGENRSRMDSVFPGDVVKFAFTLSGFFKPDEKDYLGAPKLFTDAVVDSKIEILDQTNRRLYDNALKEKDDLGTFDVPTPQPSYRDNAQKEVDNESDTDLPFVWFIPFLLPLAANMIM